MGLQCLLKRLLEHFSRQQKQMAFFKIGSVKVKILQ